MITVSEFRNILAENKEISAYEIIGTVNESRQLFYVGRELETNRSVRTEELRAAVYVDFDEFRGSSTVVITSADNAESAAEKLKAAVIKAKQGGNPYYPLVEKTENLKAVSASVQDLSQLAKEAADAIFKGEEGADSQLNATEVFVNYDTIHFLNSNDVEHEYDKYSIFWESIPSYDGEREDVELYYNKYSGLNQTDAYTSDIRTAMANVKYRYEAVKPEEVKIPENLLIAVQGGMLFNVMGNFAQELSYNSQFYKMSHFKIGDTVSEVPFDMILKGEEEGVYGSSPVDSNGIVLKATKIINQGKAEAYWGNQRFGYYLKEKEITGSYPVAVLENYPVISEEDKSRPVLYIMNFSAPQLDSDSGYFGGEVRLALLKEGDKITPLTGFSISGNVYEAINTVRFSEETDIVCLREGMSFKGPKYLYFDQLKLH